MAKGIMRSSTTLFDSATQIKVAFGNEESKTKYNLQYSDNKIITTKYNVITWMPKSLLMQFRRIANVYFLIISILTVFDFSPKNPTTMIGTFAVVLIFTMLKEAYEDIKRYNQDKEVNTKKVRYYDTPLQCYKETTWEKIRAGDMVAVSKEDDVAADLLLIKSSLDSGLCFVDTMNLDGETNLKEKMTPPGARELTYDAVCKSNGSIITEKPNENLDKWECSLTITIDNDSKTFYCSMKNFLLKGSKLKNTDKVLGIVVYTGHNTKIMKNAKVPPIKMSNLMVVMNRLLYSVYVFQIIICVVFSALYTVWISNNEDYTWYLPYKKDSFFIKLITFLVAYSHLIPISLYVALELVKLIQSLLIYYDKKIFDMNTGKPANARTSDLIEELGQVEFIFSDKTGTLTKNEMEFRKCYINHKFYGDIENDENISSKTKNTINGDPSAYNILHHNLNNSGIHSDQGIQDLQADRNGINDFFTVCSVCHSAYLEDTADMTRSYQSSSPDEVALLEAAEQMGFEFAKKTSDTIETLSYNGEYIIWELLMELPFDSTRKRMSVIVKKRNNSNNEKRKASIGMSLLSGVTGITGDAYYLFTKGADTAMLENMAELPGNSLEKIKNGLDKFAHEGLRTLVMANKYLSEADAMEYKEEASKIIASSDKDKEDQLSRLYEKIEKGFNYVGTSAIEDKLQDNVADTIEVLMNSDIRLWVLTGDKKETAIEIGKSCKLVLHHSLMDELDLASPSSKDDTKEIFEAKLDDAYRKYYNTRDEEHAIKMNEDPSVLRLNDNVSPRKLYIIIDGKNLSYVLSSPEMSKKFFKVGLQANSVICCRVSPKQKSQVVKLAKENGKWITLSIGDGANDVPMIMEAHIGIGISGKEGTQAVRSSDYAIGQFQFLQRLVLVHGRWGYRRISYFICYYFYKNIVLVFTEIYFAFYNGFSGQIFFPDLLPLCFNAFWTSWPCIIAYSIERDVDDETSIKYPILYKAGQIKYYFTMKRFWIWILCALIHGVITFYTVGVALSYALGEAGMHPDHWTYSTVCFSILIHIVTFKIFIELLYWNYFNM